MLHPHSYQEKAFDFFASFLRNVIKGEAKYQPLVEPAIRDAKLLANGDKDYYGVHRDNYDIVVFLVENDGNFFRELNTDQLAVEDYQRILALFTKQRELILD